MGQSTLKHGCMVLFELALRAAWFPKSDFITAQYAHCRQARPKFQLVG